MNKETKVVNLDGVEVPLELLANDIERIAKAGDSLLRSRLTKDTLLLLLQAEIGRGNNGREGKISLHAIGRVLDAIPSLRNALKQKKKNNV